MHCEKWTETLKYFKIDTFLSLKINPKRNVGQEIVKWIHLEIGQAYWPYFISFKATESVFYVRGDEICVTVKQYYKPYFTNLNIYNRRKNTYFDSD